MLDNSLSLTISALTQEFDGRSVFRNLDFRFDGPRGSITGPNGSGKSTLLRIAAGLLTPTEGNTTLSIAGSAVPKDAVRDVVGLVAPDVHLYDDLSPRENLEFLARTRCMTSDKSAISRALEEVGLADRADDTVESLSSGLRRRACFAAALVHHPVLLLLDEPFTNLDEDGARMVRQVIEAHSERGMVLIATNNPVEAELAEVKLDLGRLE